MEQVTGSERPKRKFEDDVQDGSASSSWEKVSTKSQKGLTLQRGQKRSAEDEEKDMEVSIMERTMQEDMRWDLMEVCDMCMPENEDLRRSVTDMKYFDENTWEELDPERVAEGERAELERFKKMGVYDYETRAVAMNDELGKFVKVKWVRTNKGTAMNPEVRCRLVAQELGYGQRMDELFAGTPSLMAVKLILHHAAKGEPEQGIMVLDVKCAFLYGQIRRRVYIELPQQDSRSADKSVVGVLREAMYGTRDAPQIWQEVEKAMRDLGFELSILHSSVFYHRIRNVIVVIHVDDFLCSGKIKDLQWLYESVKEKYDLKHTILSRDSKREVKYLNRTIRWTPLWSRIGRR